MEKVIFAKKKFLNKDKYHSTASISACIHEESLDSNWEPYSAELSISDCSRVIHLSIDLQSVEHVNNSIYKLQQLEDVSREMKEEIIKLKDKVEEWENNNNK